MLDKILGKIVSAEVVWRREQLALEVVLKLADGTSVADLTFEPEAVIKVMTDAKVVKVSDLPGKPIEASEGEPALSWRILTEVL